MTAGAAVAKSMIITGASRGIGAAVAREAANQGLDLVLNARSGSALSSIAKSIDQSGKRTATVTGDISNGQVCARIVDTALDRFGGVDVLVNNAGILGPVGPLHEVNADEWVENLMVNVVGPALLARRALDALRESRGRIVNISSGAAVKAIRGWSAYCVSKAALNQLNRMLAAEYPEIVAVAVSPGMTATDMQVMVREQGAGRMPADEHRRFVDAYERGELRSPEEVARAVVALGLHAPSDMSGEFVTVDDPRVEALVT